MIGKTKIVGEIGVNHLGNEEKALKIIDEFKDFVDYFKVQIRTPEICVPKHMWDKTKMIDGERMSYIDYKKRNELKWDDIFKKAGIPREKWFASTWDLPALERYLWMNPKSKIVKFPASFSFKQEICDDFLSYIPKDWQIFMSLPIIENPQSFLIFERLRKIYFQHIIPYLTFMTYSSGKFDVETMKNFVKLKDDYGQVGYSSHSGILKDLIQAIMLGFDYLEVHIATSECKYSSDFRCSILPLQMAHLHLFFEENTYSYEEVDWEKIKSLIPERWK